MRENSPETAAIVSAVESHRPTGGHGLPAEHHTPDGESEDWETALGYLSALDRSARPIVVAVREDGMPSWLLEQIGFLSSEGERRDLRGQPPYRSFSLFWPDREQLAGRVRLYEHLFQRATLSTSDGDDYFGLTLSFGQLRVVFMDSNIHLDHAHPRRERGLDDLPTADDFDREWAQQPESEVSARLRTWLTALREDLVTLGADSAKAMSDSELMAAGVRVRWKLRQHLRGEETLAEADWLAALASEIAAGSSEPPAASGSGDARP